jgi:ubiquinone/menaquinone biosynthesis C-methylase UbiE
MRTSVREVFAAAAECYGRGNPLLLIERPEMQALLPPLVGRDVLDLGAGPGHYASLAQASGARCAVALDLTAEMLSRGPQPALVADARRLPLRDAAFDVVIAALSISHAGAPGAVLAEVARVLRPGGVLVVSDLHAVAIKRGWRRTFATPERTLVADSHPLTREALLAAASGAGLLVDACFDVAIDARLKPAFEAAGRRDFAALEGTPLLLLLRAYRRRGPHAG